MHLAFNHMSPYREMPCASLMVESVRKHMPDTVIVQLSDKTMDPERGVDKMVKAEFDYNIHLFPPIWLRMISGVCQSEGTIVHCDADMVFSGDVNPLVVGDYDIAICKRPGGNGITDETSRQYRILHPYNIGFMIIKNPEFLGCCCDIMDLEVYHKPTWALAQHIIGLVVNSGQFKVKFLDGAIYNRTPIDVDDFVESVKVWHFKGDRKDWMVDWTKRHYV